MGKPTDAEKKEMAYKKRLHDVIGEMNNIMYQGSDGIDVTDIKGTGALETAIKNAAGQVLTTDDFSDNAWAVFALLGAGPRAVNTGETTKPEKEEKPVATTKKKAKKKAAKKAVAKKPEPKKAAPKETKAKKPAAKKKTAAKKKDEPKKIKRGDTVVDAITKLCSRKGGATLDELMTYSNKLYVAAGGKSNPRLHYVHNYMTHGLVHFGILKKEGDKFHLKNKE
jgi:hypothetical protein